MSFFRSGTSSTGVEKTSLGSRFGYVWGQESGRSSPALTPILTVWPARRFVARSRSAPTLPMGVGGGSDQATTTSREQVRRPTSQSRGNRRVSGRCSAPCARCVGAVWRSCGLALRTVARRPFVAHGPTSTSSTLRGRNSRGAIGARPAPSAHLRRVGVPDWGDRRACPNRSQRPDGSLGKLVGSLLQKRRRIRQMGGRWSG